jgi:hypothetical protein
MELYYESMTKVVYQLHAWYQLTIRCWRHEPNYKGEETDSQNASDIMAALKEIKKDEATKLSIANHLIKLGRMNAVEVLDQQSNGCVLYESWP